MTTVDHATKSIDIDCKNTLAVSVAFTSDGREIVSAERHFNGQNAASGRIRRCKIQGENLDEKARVLVDAIDGVDGVAVSKDGQWIVIIAGRRMVVRNTTTNEGVEVCEHNSRVRAIDVSPNSTRFASGSEDKTVRIFSITTGQRVLDPLQHNNSIVGVKFSPSGSYLATAAHGDPVRVWDAGTGKMLSQTSIPYFNTPNVNLAQTPACTPIGWSSEYRVLVLARIAHGRVLCQAINAFQSNVSSPHQSWFYPATSGEDSTPCSLATNERFVACSAGGSLSFWDPSSYRQIGPTIKFQDSILSIALSSDDTYLACGRSDKKITVYALRDILPLHFIFDATSRLPLMNMSNEEFKVWMEQATYYTSYPNYHGLALRALAQARTNQWYTAVEDANQSLAAQPTIIGHIAKAVALVGHGKHELAFEAFDAAFCNCGADETRFLLLIKAILLFVSGKREYAIARVKDLIAAADESEKYNCLQVLASMYLKQGDAERTMDSFERAYSLSFSRQGFHLVTILLIFGRSFEEHEITVRRPLRGAIPPDTAPDSES